MARVSVTSFARVFFKKHGEQNYFPSRWGVSMLKNPAREAVLKKLRCGPTSYLPNLQFGCTMACYFPCLESPCCSVIPCQCDFCAGQKKSGLEFRFLHCKFSCRMLGEETDRDDTACVENGSNISFQGTPITSLGQ